MRRTDHFNKIRPITSKMKEMLKACHERETHQQAPHSIYYSQSARGLVTRGLLYAKEYSGREKPYMGFYITQLGVQYLDEYLEQ